MLNCKINNPYFKITFKNLIPPIYKRNLKIWASVIAVLLCSPHFLYAAERVIESDQARLILESSAGWNIPDGDTLRITYTGSISDPAALLRDTSGNASYWGGTYESNYNTVLVNTRGIIIGPNANIQAASFIASTLNISNDDFLNDRYNFYKVAGNNAFIINRGKIIVRNGGYVALLSQAVENKGVILANLGRVVLASGEKMTLALDDINEISVVIDEAVKDVVLGENGERIVSAVKNSGTISANGGKVILTAKVLNNVFNYAINNTGIIEAQSVANHNGVIELTASGAPIVNTGTLEAGAIRVNAQDTTFINKGKLIAGSEPTLPDSGKIAIQVGSLVQGGLISADRIVTVEAERVEVVLDGPLALEIDPLLNISPGVIIQAPEVKIIAKQFGSRTTPLNINAALTYIYRTQGDINILESLGIGTSVLLRGPPDGFGAIVYNRDTNLTLEAQAGGITTYDSAIIRANNLSLIANQNIGSINQHVYFTANALIKVTSYNSSIYIDSNNSDIYIIGEVRAHGDINIYSGTGMIDVRGQNAIVAAEIGYINLEATTGIINNYGLISAPYGTVRLWTSTLMDGSGGRIISIDYDVITNPEDESVTTWINPSSSNWNTASNWSAGVPNAANERAVINTAGITVTLNANITIGGLEILDGILLFSDNANRTLTIVDTDNTIGGNAGPGGLYIGTSGTLTFDDNRTGQKVIMAGNYTNLGILNRNIGAIEFNKASGTQTLNSGGTAAAKQFYDITHSGAGILQIITNNVTLTHNLTVSAGTLDPNGFTITGSGTNTLTVTGKLIVDAVTFTGNYVDWDTRTINAGSTIDYQNANPTIDASLTYQNLQFSGAGTADVNGTLTIQGDLTNTGGGTLDFGVNNVTLSGNVATNNIASFITTGTVSMTKTAGTVTFTGDMNVGALTINGNGGTLNLGTGTHTISGTITLTAGTLDLADSSLGGSGNITFGGGTLRYGGASTQDISSRIKNSTSAVNIDTGANTITFSSVIDNSNTGGLTKKGTGALILSATNTYTGTTTISAGALGFSSVSAIPSGNLILNGGVLATNGTFSRALGTGDNQVQFGANGGGFSAYGGALSITGFTGTPVWSNTTNFLPSGAPLIFGDSTLSNDVVTWTNDFSLRNAARTITVNDNPNTTDDYAIISGVISSSGTSGSLTKDGSGALVLSATNTYTGTTTISAGALGFSSVSVIPSGNLILDGGVLATNGTFSRALGSTGTGKVRFTNTTNGGGFSAYGGSLSVTITGTLTWNSTNFLQSGAPLIFGDSTLSDNVVTWISNFSLGTIGTNTRTITVNDNSSTTADYAVISGVISGSANNSLTKNGTGALALSGSNTYAGGTTVNAGTLSVNNTNALGTGALTATAVGNTVNYSLAGAQTIISTTYYNLTLSGSGTKTAGGALTVNGTLTNSVTLDMAGYTLSAGSIVNTGGTIRFSGVSNGLAIPTGTVEYYGTNQTVATGLYETINLTAISTYTPNGAITATDLTNAGTLDMGTYDLDVSSVTNNGTIRLEGSNGTFSSISTGTVEYYNAGIYFNWIAGYTYDNLVLSGGGTYLLVDDSLITNNLTVSAGTTFDPNGYYLTGSGIANISGTILVDAATFSGNYSGFSTVTFNVGSTVNYSSSLIDQDIDSTLDYTNATLETSGSGTKTLSGPATVTNVIVGVNTTFDPAGNLLTGSGTADIFGTIKVDADLFGNNYAFSGGTLESGSTVNYCRLGNQEIDNMAPTGYSNLVISGNGTKTLGGNTTVNDLLSMQGTASLALSTYTLTYGGSATLEYKGTAVQTTGPELAAIIPNLIVDNINGVILSSSPTISGTLTLTNGKFLITVTAVTDSKPYNGTTVSAGVPTVTSGNLIAGDSITSITQTFSNRNAGTGKTLNPAVTINDGNGGNNYAVTLVADTTGVINQEAITITAVTDTKGYNGDTTSAGIPTVTSGAIQAGDSITSITQTFSNRNAGTGKTLNPAVTINDGNGGNNYAVTL
ncbi:MAG: autotransporter-associated beta strand repeat-containing protein, partial [Candidatus Omnitrophica bacterium]|nr:autotransporter-associated beta strand repeat-containing protein [Candidatus Omnitrophota bacterium]MDD5592597.1 autotransporter-associated beta strand repeat-containing protein [Candidatus Omnitrophota bacterium]